MIPETKVLPTVIFLEAANLRLKISANVRHPAAGISAFKQQHFVFDPNRLGLRSTACNLKIAKAPPRAPELRELLFEEFMVKKL